MKEIVEMKKLVEDLRISQKEIVTRVNYLNSRINDIETVLTLSARVRNRAEFVLKDEARKRLKAVGGKHQTLWADIRREFGVSSYRDIPEAYIPKALSLIRTWVPSDASYQPRLVITPRSQLNRKSAQSM